LLENLSTSILDIGTGAGVLSFITLHEAKKGMQSIVSLNGLEAGKRVSIVATDINPMAIECATFNAGKLHFLDNIRFELCNLFPSSVQKYDLIVCNPPYVPDVPHNMLELGKH
jgi:methylase of polypeptide subunit release factors